MSAGENAAEALAEIRRLVERFPLPHPIWHRFVPEMHDVVRDIFVALDAIAELPGAQAALLRHMDVGPADAVPHEDGTPALAAARARLRDLPVPSGEHPYLDEILVTLEAGRILLAALTHADGEAAFASRLRQG